MLQGVDLILCEDTRNSRRLLSHYGLDRPLMAVHDHNEAQRSGALILRLGQGENFALISDAGTPLINDPGYPLVVKAIEAGIRVVPIPGPCALIAALSASGLPVHRFAFEGFPPRRSKARLALFETLRDETRTLVFYESSHRLEETLGDLARVFPEGRRLVVARELTKVYETILHQTVGEALARLKADPDQGKGEFVLMVEGAPPPEGQETLTPEASRVLGLLLKVLPPSTAARVGSEILHIARPILYEAAVRSAALSADSASRRGL